MLCYKEHFLFDIGISKFNPSNRIFVNSVQIWVQNLDTFGSNYLQMSQKDANYLSVATKDMKIMNKAITI